jgi:hypothetical protein
VFYLRWRPVSQKFAQKSCGFPKAQNRAWFANMEQNTLVFKRIHTKTNGFEQTQVEINLTAIIFALSPSGLRVRPLIANFPLFASALATEPPCAPVNPTTAIVGFVISPASRAC